MEQLSRAALEANLIFAEKQLKDHEEKGVELKEKYEEAMTQILKNPPNGDRREMFQAVFDEENFTDAIWFLQDEPEISVLAMQFHYWKKQLEETLVSMGVKIQ